MSSFKLRARAAGVVLPLRLSLLMTCLVSLISTLMSDSVNAVLWLRSWPIAFPIPLLVLPIVRRPTALLVRPARP
ncbi:MULTISPECIES: DUF2798 domain-containing protein [Nocardia]|nr:MULTISPECIES: DUF2798 domain-containing protein [Nocardia]